MKKTLFPLLIVLVAFFQGCRGPEGPQGPAGESLAGITLDLVNVNFNAANEYQYVMSFADARLEVLESDAVLVYSNWEDVQQGNQNVAAYRLLPQTAFFENGGILTYNFDRTVNDISIFLDGTVNLATVGTEYTQNQSFRIIVLPADFAARTSGSIDYKDYNAVVKAFNIDESKIRTISAK